MFRCGAAFGEGGANKAPPKQAAAASAICATRPGSVCAFLSARFSSASHSSRLNATDPRNLCRELSRDHVLAATNNPRSSAWATSLTTAAACCAPDDCRVLRPSGFNVNFAIDPPICPASGGVRCWTCRVSPMRRNMSCSSSLADRSPNRLASAASASPLLSDWRSRRLAWASKPCVSLFVINELNLFFTAFSALPGKPRAISDHLLPTLCWASSNMASSSGVQSDFTTLESR
mmetsp:Transcript_3920/g.11060  ORF Transcript_3920/g.11060 Transcript_3920/m.11060 type:complete len:233 (+) Transcript_3920:697-1395(+)